MSGAAPLSPEAIFRANGGQLRMSEALAAGISRYQLYQLRDKGLIEAISRGLYRLSDLPPISTRTWSPWPVVTPKLCYV